MANSIFGIIPSQQTDAEFRAWGSILSAQFSALLTRVTTTGDINWTTVTKPATPSAYQGFEVYCFNDAVQSTHPVFFKFEYGSGSSGASFCSLRLTIAKNCAADGVLSNIIFPATLIFSVSNSNTTTSINCYLSSHISGFGLAICPANTLVSGILLVERAIDSNGVVNGEGLYVGFKSSSGAGANNHYYISYSASTLNSVLAKGIFPVPLDLSVNISLANGTITPYFPAACLNPSGLYWIPRIALGGAQADCALGAVVNNLLDGINYIGLGGAASGADQRTSTYGSLMMRW